jgi:hypothetical protein
MYEAAVAGGHRSWNEVEANFLRAMEAFDANVAAGIADMGDLQNGKGDFFNDLLALLLENCAGVQLYARGGVPGLIFPRHNLDVTFPPAGVVEFLLEAKAVGTPKHPGSPKEKDMGRNGAADLDKRIKEIGFKTIDLKAEYARIMAQRGTTLEAPRGDLTSWLHSVKPRSYLFISARVTGQPDLMRVEHFARAAGQVVDAVGVYCYMPTGPRSPTTYRAAPVGPDIELERVLFRACQDLSAIKAGLSRQVADA